jgi:tetratricopeptide (TPR) repeat protein
LLPPWVTVPRNRSASKAALARRFASGCLVAAHAKHSPEPYIEVHRPSTYDGWMSQADRLQQAGRSSPALQAYSEALALKPQDVEAMTGKGLCLLDLGNNSGAVAAFQAALQVNSRYGDAIIGLAEAYKYKRDNANALKYYKRYLEVLPNGPEASVAKSNLEQLK